MRVLLDTNVFLSYILAPNRQGVVTAVVAACLSQSDITLLIPSEQIVELVDKLTNKRYFRIHVSRTVVEHFVTQLNGLCHPASFSKCCRKSRTKQNECRLAVMSVYPIPVPVVPQSTGFR